MSKRLILMLVLAFVVAITGAAYAEVQNVKVSGDITVSGLSRENFNLSQGVDGDKKEDHEDIFMSQIRLRVDADLTDNVAATLRLINERAWAQESNTNTDIDLDLAYVTLKEFLYSPLTLTVGRQEMRFGNGLIIGNGRNTGTTALNVPQDLSLRKAFDAIRATLDYDPLVLDVFYAKLEENTGTQNDDVDLAGVNARYDVNANNSAEAYLFFRKDSNDADVAATDKSDRVYTLGALLTNTAIENLKASIEGAYQFGHRRAAGGETDYKAWALQPMLTYDIRGTKLDKYLPQVGLCYTYLSGNKVSDDSSRQLWNPMYYDQALNNITYAILPFSNLQVINLKGKMKPADDVTLMANYGYYRLAKKVTSLKAPFANSDNTNYGSYTMKGDKDLGSALDLTAIYDYTEDVQLGLTAGMFFPGKAFDSPSGDGKAVQVIGSMKVTF
ncbi:MAG: alginate export family protein [Candidatus Omnitrophota bacterium]|jgi:hypothetical protein